uniref:Uncharacterized protein n=1 Tax=Candidatus Methanogaster sp. ANME-2c ERB4 TaxID=2759911 RepID=A0A7G9Y6Y2_9EURY|nr:hypothetical protein PBPLAEBB_00001 [Methanosarcinales archaeon ANME-2c ERB4]
MEHGSFGYERGIDLQMVRAERGITKKRLKHVPVVVGIRSGKPDHYVESDLKPALTQSLVGSDCVLHGMPAIDLLEYTVIGALNTYFHLRCAHLKQAVNLLSGQMVRAGFKGDSDIPDRGSLVRGDYGFDIDIKVNILIRHARAAEIVHSQNRLPDKPLLVIRRTGCECPAHHDQFNLVDRMPDALQLPQPDCHLLVRVVAALDRTHRGRLSPHVTLRRLEYGCRTARARDTCAMRARVRRGHHRNNGNA